MVSSFVELLGQILFIGLSLLNMFSPFCPMGRLQLSSLLKEQEAAVLNHFIQRWVRTTQPVYGVLFNVLPLVGLFSAVCETYVKRRVSDISILPVSICYESRLEENLLVWELLGVPKPKELTSVRT